MKNIRILLLLIKAFGFRSKFVFTIIFRFSVELLISISILLDNIFFSGYRKVEVKKPVFLIGHPRSGTTFLHRYIEKNVKSLRTIYMWEMIFPTLSSRKIAKLFFNKISKISLDKIWDPKIHRTSLVTPETEDIALFFRYFEGYLSWVYFNLWHKYSNQEELESLLLKQCNQDKFIYYLRDLHKKNLYKTDKRMFSKSFALLFNIDTILKVFPDAKILIMIRDPLQALPSFMSLEKHIQTQLNQLDKSSKEFQLDYYQGIYNTSLCYFKKVHEIMTNKEKYGNSIMLISNKQLLSDFGKVIDEILEFYEIEKNDDINLAIEQQLIKQQNFKSEHKYSLEQFGISEEQILNDFDFIYKNYNV